MIEAIKPTPGPWVAVGSGGPWEQRISIRAAHWGTVAAVGVDPSLPHWDGPQRANASLIAEAGTVRHETGLSPRQLVGRVKELEEALREYMSAFGQALEAHGIQFAQQQVIADELARAALSKSLPNTVAEVK